MDEASVTDAPIGAVTVGVTAAFRGVKVAVWFFAFDSSTQSLRASPSSRSLPGGVTIVEPGVDHYFDRPDRELRSLALLEVLLKRLEATTSVSGQTLPLAEGAAHASLRPE